MANMQGKAKELYKMKETIEKDFMANHLDPSSPSYERSVNTIINEAFNRAVDSVTYPGRRREALSHSYLYGDVLRKRKKVNGAFCKKFRKDYENRFPAISIEEEVGSFLCMPSHTNYDYIDFHNFIAEAAALYILDQLKAKGMLHEAMKYMPKDEDSLFLAVCNEDALDMCHSDEVIRSLVYLIQNQNLHLKGNDSSTMYLQDVMVKREVLPVKEEENIEEWDENTKLRQIFSLMDPLLVKRALKRFKEDVEHFVLKVLEIANGKQKRINTIADYALTMLNKQIQEEKASVLRTEQEISTEKLSKLVDAMTDLDECNEIGREKDDFYWSAANLYQRGTEDFIGEDEDLDRLYELEVANPFETCFSFIYLYTMNDDLIWIMNACAPVLMMACEKLPWNKDTNENFFEEDFEEEEEELSLEEEEERRKEREEEIKKLLEQVEESKLSFLEKTEAAEKEYYALKYNDAANYIVEKEDEDKLQKVNFPQLFHMLSDVIPPRKVYVSEEIKKDLIASGLKQEEAEIFEYMLDMAEATWGRTVFPGEEEEDEETRSLRIDKENDLKQANKMLKAEVKRLKDSLHELNKTLELERNNSRKKAKEKDTEQQELIRLRELLYELQNNEAEAEEEVKEEIVFPYRPEKRIVIFGGNVNWQNAMRKLLEGVRIIDSDQLPDIGMIRHAQEIWIQTRSFSHSYYNRITQAAGPYKIAIRYFAHSGAEGCAREIVHSDIEEK